MCGSSHVRPCFTPRAFPSKQVDGSLSSQPVAPPPNYLTIITLINKNSTWLSNFKYPARYHVPGLCFLLALLSPSIRRYLSIDNTPTPLLIGYPLHKMSTPVLSYTDVKSETLPQSKCRKTLEEPDGAEMFHWLSTMLDAAQPRGHEDVDKYLPDVSGSSKMYD